MSGTSLRPPPSAVTLALVMASVVTIVAAAKFTHGRPADPIGCEGCCDEGGYWPEPPTCANPANDDHCYRELYRAQLEALEANRDYDEIASVSPSGASFATPVVVRRPRLQLALAPPQ